MTKKLDPSRNPFQLLLLDQTLGSRYGAQKNPMMPPASGSNGDESSYVPPWLGGDGTGWGDSGNGSGGGGMPNALWTFPQYSQTWAFTPPPASGYTLPPAFDINSDTGYAAPRKSTSALAAVAKRAKSK